MNSLKNLFSLILILTLLSSNQSFAQSNVALNKSTSQSSNYSSNAGQSYKAVDGNTNGYWSNGSITHTRGGSGENNPWWKVDLGKAYAISQIKIYNRLDCCSNRINNMKVYVKGEGNNAQWTLYYPYAYQYRANNNPIVLNGNAQARYVKVQLVNPNGILSLAEVQVYGTQLLESHNGNSSSVAVNQEYKSAIKGGRIGCGRGTIYDPIDGGTCWTCPDGYNRTVFSVKSNKACERPAGERFARANRHSRGGGLLGTDCPGGQFWDPNGYCYSCPSGYSRTAYPVTSDKACSQRVHADYKAARLYSSAKDCQSGYFFDPGTNKCWTCPNGFKRTVFPVNGEKACEKISVRTN
ncbi:MAG: discoidin domain-containing protein [Chitinophagales bacterium]|nr:discoidin domain-containing protein [Chitinophagales bacterium]